MTEERAGCHGRRHGTQHGRELAAADTHNCGRHGLINLAGDLNVALLLRQLLRRLLLL